MNLHPSLSELLRKARQRSITQLLLHQLVLAAAIGCGGAALILLAGTRFLSWYWLVLVVGVSLGVGLYFWRKRLPSTYGVAQRIDAKLKLADTLSTAVYFQESPGSADATIREGQRRQAEHLAESVDLKRALPFTRPRALYPAAGLALAVVAIFLMRYAVLGSFDPRTSLVASAYDSFFGAPKQQAQQFAGSPEDASRPGDGSQKNQADKNSDFAGDPSGKFDPESSPDQKQQQDSKQAENKDQQGDGEKKQDSPSANQMQQEGNQNSQGDSQQPSGNQNAKASQDPSLLNKLREALSDMLNKMKSSPSESAQNQKGEQNQSEQAGQQSQSQENGESQQAQNGQQSSDPQNQGNNGKSKPSEQQQSGIGSQEGDKTAKQAEALKAMGKITELLGKRAENVKGAVMVEVGSTKQQLKTPVLQSQSTHAEAGSEIHRDEVPPMYEQFVQQYFEQIRKPSQNGKSVAAPPASQ